MARSPHVTPLYLFLLQLIKIEGSAVDTISETTLTLDVEFGSSDGKLQLNVDQCALDIGKLDIRLDGGAGGFYQVRRPGRPGVLPLPQRSSSYRWVLHSRPLLPEVSRRPAFFPPSHQPASIRTLDVPTQLKRPGHCQSDRKAPQGYPWKSLWGDRLQGPERHCRCGAPWPLGFSPTPCCLCQSPTPNHPHPFLLQVLPKVPVSVPLGHSLEVDYALVNTSNLQGLSGTHYSHNDFSGDTKAAVYTGAGVWLCSRSAAAALGAHITIMAATERAHAPRLSLWSPSLPPPPPSPPNRSLAADFTVSLGAYESIDVGGFFRTARNGSYAFQMHFDQAAKVDSPGGSAGHLEDRTLPCSAAFEKRDQGPPSQVHMHHACPCLAAGLIPPPLVPCFLLPPFPSFPADNPGMCWPEYHTDTTGYFNASAGVYYPVRVRFQSGCGGGHLELRLCEQASGNCDTLSPLNVTTNTTQQLPLLIDDDAILLASGAEVFSSAAPREAPYPHGALPTHLPANFNESRHMLALYLDPFFLSSAVYGIAEAGLFNLTINDSMIPPDVHKYIQLNTTYFRFIFPELYKRFPNDLMLLTLFPGEVRAVDAIPGQGLSGGLSLYVNVSVLQGGRGGIEGEGGGGGAGEKKSEDGRRNGRLRQSRRPRGQAQSLAWRSPLCVAVRHIHRRRLCSAAQVNPVLSPSRPCRSSWPPMLWAVSLSTRATLSAMSPT